MQVWQAKKLQQDTEHRVTAHLPYGNCIIFHNKFVNSNDMWDLQIYVMTILTVKQAFCESECETMKIKSFEPDLFIFNSDNTIVSLC
ncbi:hypothetical protein HK096_010142, partial [Nowakowskiella sp. JEL0078]